MKPLIIEAAKDKPKVILDPSANHFEISGKSFPEDCASFYAPVEKWLENYDTDKTDPIDFKFNLEFISSTSIIYLFEVMTRLGQIEQAGIAVKVTWHFDHDDDEIRSEGERLAEETDLKFIFQENP